MAANLLTSAQSILGTVADDVVQLDSYFDRLLGQPSSDVPTPPSNPPVSVPPVVATTPTTLTAGRDTTQMLILAGVILLAIWLVR